MRKYFLEYNLQDMVNNATRAVEVQCLPDAVEVQSLPLYSLPPKHFLPQDMVQGRTHVCNVCRMPII